jgi:transposase
MEAGVSGWRERRRITIDAGDLVRLGEAVTKAKEKFCWKGGSPVVSGYEAGRDGFWLHRYLLSIGIQHQGHCCKNFAKPRWVGEPGRC